MMLSFVIPAHNEEQLLSSTIRAFHTAARGEEYEVLVVDEDSSDRTANIAIAEGVRVISVRHHQIAATRHAGACATRGDLLLCVDADTLISAVVVREALAAIAQGAAGGVALGVFEGESYPSMPEPLRACGVALPAWLRSRPVASFSVGARRTRQQEDSTDRCSCSRRLPSADLSGAQGAWRSSGKRCGLRAAICAHSLRDAGRMLLLLARHRGAFFRSRDGLGYWYEDRR